MHLTDLGFDHIELKDERPEVLDKRASRHGSFNSSKISLEKPGVE